MESKSLMIGDWVTFKDCQYENPIPIKIVAVGYQADTENDCLVQIYKDSTCDIIEIDDEIVGIPLTAEILEKNGFIKDANKDNKLTDTYHLLVPTGFERKSFTIQVNLYKEPICGVSTLIKCWGWLLPHNGGLNDIHLCSANYVHELQHAMRLCGIGKEIEL